MTLIFCRHHWGVAYLVFRKVVGEAADEDLVVAIGDRARDYAQRRQVHLGDRPQTGQETTKTTITRGILGDIFRKQFKTPLETHCLSKY